MSLDTSFRSKLIPFLVFVSCLVGAGQSRGQWVNGTSGTTEPIRAFCAITDSTVFAVGDNSTLIWTADQGRTWLSLGVTKIPGNYYAVASAFSGNTLYVAGDFGIAYSTSGGALWKKATTPQTAGTINAIAFPLDTLGVAVGDNGVILRSTDKGVTWSTVAPEFTTANINALSSNSFGYLTIVGAAGFAGSSIDYGLSWIHDTLPSTADFYGVGFTANSDGGWVVGNGVILWYNGTSWEQQKFNSPILLRSVSVVDYYDAFVAGDNGRILRTTDDSDWSDVLTETADKFYSIRMINDTTGWAGGDKGAIYSPPRSSSSVSSRMQEGLLLSANYPNPFSRATQFSYTLPKSQRVTITIFDQLGRAVSTIVDEEQSAGTHPVMWDAAGISSGIYLCRLTAGGATLTQRFIHTN